ncbi:MAG: hypothetical protein GX606_01290 [Elusimicrobia bacterium]|nr:hypothetical protein [Elusimicrobiota bacterium]
MNPLPTDVLVARGVKRIIAVNVLQTPEDVIKGYQKTRAELQKALEVPFLTDPWAFLEIRFKFLLNKAFFPNISDIIVRTLEASESVIAEQSARSAHILIHPDLSGLNWYELYRGDLIIEKGEEAARRQIDRIRHLIQHKTKQKDLS